MKTKKNKKKYLMNWNILVIKGKEKNKNFVSSGERKQKRLLYYI